MRRIGSALTALALGATLGGCWLQPGYDAGRTNWNASEGWLDAGNVGLLAEVWDTQVPSATGVNAPLAFGGAVYATTTSGDAAAIDDATGTLRWSRDFYDEPSGFAPSLSAPAWHRGALWVPGAVYRFGGLLQLSPADGTTVSGGFGGNPTGAVSVADDQVASLSGTFNSSGFGLASVVWKYSPTILYTLSGSVPGSDFAIVGDRVLWSQGPQALGFSPACPPQPPEIPIGGCAPDWATDLGGGRPTSPAAVGPSGVVYADATGTVTVLDVVTGAVQWTAELGAATSVAPAVAGDAILVATDDGRLVALPAAGCGAATCTPVWEASVGGTPATAPVVGGEVVYVATTAGDVAAFPLGGCASPPPCAPLTTVSAGSRVTGGPIVHDGRVVVGTEDGRLVAFGLPG